MIGHILTFIICIAATTIGGICGVGGGIIIKPLLDLIQYADVATCSFLSGCTVLAMTSFNVVRGWKDKQNPLIMSAAGPIAIGAALGGVVGKVMFDLLRELFIGMGVGSETVGAVQAVILALTMVASIWYTAMKGKLTPHPLKGPAGSVLAGLALGIISSFLGIGGGPLNMIVLFFFYGFDTKTAAKHSLFVIVLCQGMSLLTTIAAGNVPGFSWFSLCLMVAAGICGGMAGRKINKKLDNKKVDRLFIGFQAVVILICGVNFMNMV